MCDEIHTLSQNIMMGKGRAEQDDLMENTIVVQKLHDDDDIAQDDKTS